MDDILRLAYDIVRRRGYADGGFPGEQDDEKRATRLARDVLSGEASDAFGPDIGPNYSGEQFGPPMPSFSPSPSPSPSAGKTNEPVETIGRSDFLPGIGKSPTIDVYDLPAPAARSFSPQPEITQPTTNPSPSAGVFSFGPQTGQAQAGFAPGTAFPGSNLASDPYGSVAFSGQQAPSAATFASGFSNPATSYGSTLGSNIMGAKENVGMDEYNQNIASNLIDTHTVNAAPAQSGAQLPGLEQQSSALLAALEAQNAPQAAQPSSGFGLSGYSAPSGFNAASAPGVGYVGPTSLSDYTQNTSSFASANAAPQADPDVAAQQKADAFEAMIAAQDAQLGLDPTSPGSPAATAAEQAAAAQAAQDALSLASDPETGLSGLTAAAQAEQAQMAQDEAEAAAADALSGGYGPSGDGAEPDGSGGGGTEPDGGGAEPDGGGGDPGAGGGGGEPERRGGRIYARGGYADGGEPLVDKAMDVTMKAYEPTWRDRIAQTLVGDGRASPERRNFVQGLMGSTGLGTAGLGVADLVPGGQALGAQEALREGDYKGAAMAMMPLPAARVSNPIKAYHGSPHSFDKFDMSKIGTGEGAQAYGHGLYFAEQEPVAKGYRDALSGTKQSVYWNGAPIAEDSWAATAARNLDAGAKFYGFDAAKKSQLDDLMFRLEREKKLGPYGRVEDVQQAIDFVKNATPERLKVIPESSGSMYEVNIHADPNAFLDWDKPLGQQSQIVKDALASFGPNAPPPAKGPGIRNRQAILSGDESVPGDVLYNNLGGFRLPAQTSAAMREAGIPGIKYLDQGSRAAGDGSRNYVVFDDRIIEIARKYGIPVATAAALFYGNRDQAVAAEKAEGGAVYDPMGNVTMPPEEGFAPSPIYDRAMDAIAKSGSAVGSPVTRALQTAADVYSEKSREAAAENEALRQQAMRNMQGELGYAGMPLGAGQMLLSQLGTATLPLTAAAKTAGYAATQATGNPRFGENVEMLSGFVDPSHVGMLKAAAPMMAVKTARELSPLGLYSHGAEAAAALQQAKGSPEQMLAQLRSAGVRPAELFSTGIADEAATNALRAKIESEMSPRVAQAEETLKSLVPGTKEFKDAERQLNNLKGTMRSEMDRALVIAPDWASRPSVTREEIAQRLREQMPVLEETVLGGAREPTRFDIYNLPGGENYREIALTIPGEGKYRVPEAHSMGEGADINRVAHIRMADRTGPNGEKILHVEELQSDWGQQGRKEGFKDPNFAKWRAERDKLDAEWKKSTEEYQALAKEIEPPVDFRFEPGKMSPREYERQLDALERAREKRIQEDPRMQALDRRRNELAVKFGQLGLAPSSAGVPRGPYVTSTEGWTDLALKRVLKEAAEGGYDKVVFTPGAEQAKRYNLSTHVGKVRYFPDRGDLRVYAPDGRQIMDRQRVSPDDLSEYIGKETAERLLSPEARPSGPVNVHELRGLDLNIGGEGMSAYYDKMVPKRLQELVRKHDKGAKVGYIEGALPEGVAAPGITITPAMRESILRGQPHMAEGGAVEAKGFDKGGSIVSKIARFKDAPAKRISDWEWRPLKDVATDLALTKVPPHVQAFGDYMKEISEKAAKEGLTARDLLKAFTMTRASIQRQAVDADKIRALGMDIPSDVKKVRPEGAWAEWLMTPMGKRYLDAASKGTVEGNAVADAIRIMAPFGRHETDIPDAMKWAAENIPGRESAASDLIARALQGESPPSAWREFTSDIRGVGPSKSGFFASLIGRGDQPTLDARQIILNTGRPTKESSKFIARGGGEGGVEAVERLANRQRALNLELPSEYDPFYQHLAHHSIWDRVGDEVTTHGDIVRAMRESSGGAVDRAHRAEGGKTEEERRAVELANGIKSYENTVRAIAAQPENVRSMTHAPERPRAPVSIEGGFIGKREIGSAPYDVARGLSVLPQAVYDLKTAPLYAAGAIFPPAAAIATALDVAEGVASGSPTQVAAGAFGAPGKVTKYGLAPLTAGVGLTAPDEAEAAASKALQKATRILSPKSQAAKSSSFVRAIPAGSQEHAIISAKEALDRLVSPFSDNPESVKRALEIAATYRIPQGAEMGAGSFFQTKPSVGVQDIKPKIAKLPGIEPLPQRPMTWEEFGKEAKGGTLINVGGDRMNLGLLQDINDAKKLAWDVPLHAGPKYMLEPNPGLVWANAPGHTTVFDKIIKSAAERGPVYGVYAPMGPTAVDSSVDMFNAVMSQMPTSKITKASAKEFDKMVKSGSFVSKVADRPRVAEMMKEKWPGILNLKDQESVLALAKDLSGTQRGDLVKEIEKAYWRDRGFPEIGVTRVAVTDPSLLSAPQNTIGHRVVRFDTEGNVSPIRKFSHPTYPTESVGSYVADLPLVQTQYGMPTAMDQLLAKRTKAGEVMHPYSLDPLGRSSARKMFTEQKQVQPVDDRLIESIMLGLERQKKYGLKRGGSVSHQAMMIAKDSARRPAALWN